MIGRNAAHVVMLIAGTNTTFTLDRQPCVDSSSVRSNGDRSFDDLCAGFESLIGSSSTFNVTFAADAESEQYSPFNIDVFDDQEGLAYHTGRGWGHCDGGNHSSSVEQSLAHEIYHHIPVASGHGMNFSEEQAENPR